MTLPTTDEFLDSLYRMRLECLSAIAAAEGRGDLKEARSLQMNIRKINSMIIEKGGAVDT